MAALPLLPSEGETLDIKSNMFRSIKSGLYTRKIPLESIIKSLATTLKVTSSIKDTSDDVAIGAERINTNIKKLVELKPEQVKEAQAEEATLEEKPQLSATNKNKKKPKKKGMNILALAALIPILGSDKFKEMVGGFFQTFLKSLGVSQKAINVLKFIVNHLKEIFLAYFGIKVFKQVMEAFNAMKKLAQVTGILAEVSQESNAPDLSELEGERKKTRSLKEREKVLKRRLKRVGVKYNARTRMARSLKKSLRAVQNKFNRIKSFATKTYNALREVVKIKNVLISFKRLVFDGLRGILKAVRVVKAGLAATGIGLLIGVAVDAAIGTALDFFSSDPEKGESKAGQIGRLFADNVIKSVTFGFADLNSVKRLFNKLVNILPIPDWLKKKIKFEVADERQEKETGSVPETKPAPASSAAPAAAAPPAIPVAAPPKEAAASSSSTPSKAEQVSSPPPSATSSSQKIPEASSTSKPSVSASSTKPAAPADNTVSVEGKSFNLPDGWAVDPSTGYIVFPRAYKLMGAIRLNPEKTTQEQIYKINKEFIEKEKLQNEPVMENTGFGKKSQIQTMSEQNKLTSKFVQRDSGEQVVVVNNNNNNVITTEASKVSPQPAVYSDSVGY